MKADCAQIHFQMQSIVQLLVMAEIAPAHHGHVGGCVSTAPHGHGISGLRRGVQRHGRASSSSPQCCMPGPVVQGMAALAAGEYLFTGNEACGSGAVMAASAAAQCLYTFNVCLKLSCGWDGVVRP